MPSKYLYLLLNIGSFIVPFLFSFYPRANFSKQWKYYLPAITITAIIFIVWDEWFTRMGVWGFNPDYVSGLYLFALPVEEILFFFCIPYACLFTYFAMNYLVTKDYLQHYKRAITLTLIIVCFVTSIVFYNRLYTLITFSSLGVLLAIIYSRGRFDYLGRFFFSFVLLLIPFFIVNGILTGSWIEEPIVWYNNNENIGFRLGTIPVEDIFYAMLMLLMSISIARFLEYATAIKNKKPFAKRA